MAIKIKRSTGDLAPAELAAGQLAYSEGAQNGGTLYYGEVGGTVREIAGKKFVDKLNGIAAGAEVNEVDSVAGKTGAVTLDSGDITDFDTAVQAVSINDIVEDTTPQLGGNLDVNGKNITDAADTNSFIKFNDAQITGAGILLSTGNKDISISAGDNRTVFVGAGGTNGAAVFGGVQSVKAYTVISGSTTGANLTSSGNYPLNLTTNSGTNSGLIRIPSGANQSITIEPNGTGDILAVADTLRVGDVNSEARITTAGTGNLLLNTNSGTNSGSITINQGANANIEIAPNGTGKIVLDGLSWPDADGSSGYVLKTNGSGVLGWSSVNDLTASIGSSEIITALGYTPEDAANKGQAGGYASLDEAGKVPASQLPSYVDDVIEVAEFEQLPTTGETGKIYIDIETGKAYRWSGSVYIEIVASPGSTDALAEGNTNLYYTDARARAAISAENNISYEPSTGVISGPDISTVGFTGSYDDLIDKPTLFSGDYEDLTSKPTLFSGDYEDLTSKPTLFSGSYTDLTDKPTLFSGDYEDLTGKPDLSVYLAEVSEDTTPQLGGNLDVAGNSIVSIDNGNINISPDGTGEVIMNAAIVKFGDNGDTGNANFGSQSGNTRIQGQITPTPGGVITLTGGTNGGITITPAGTGSTSITSGSLSVPNGGITSGGVNIITNTSITGSSLVLAQAHSTADANNFTLARARGTWANQSAVQSGDELAEFFVSGNDGSATTSAGLKAAWFWNTTMTDAPSTGLMPHRTDYKVNTTADQFATYMSVANDAIVRVREIGTTSDVTNLNISAGTDGNIQLSPNGTGILVVATDKILLGDANATATITTNGTGDLVLDTNGGTNSGSITVQQGTAGDLRMTPSGNGYVVLGPVAESARITSNGANSLELFTNKDPSSSKITVAAGTNGNITLAPNGTGKVVISGLSYPTADGTANQVLKTDGSGNLSFVDQTAGVTTFVGLTDTPNSFSGAAGYYAKVNSGATALEFSQDVDDGTF